VHSFEGVGGYSAFIKNGNMIITVYLLILITFILTLLLVWAVSRPGKKGAAGNEGVKPISSAIDVDERESYIRRMVHRQRKVKWGLLLFVMAVLTIPFFITVSDTLSLKEVLSKDRYALRMRDSYILLACMMGVGLLFYFFISMLFKNMHRHLVEVILGLDRLHFEMMKEINNHLNVFEGFMIAPPFIVGQQYLYVFKWARVLSFPWQDITEIKITGALRRGFFVRVIVEETTYFFGIGERELTNVLQREAPLHNPDIVVTR